MSERPDPPASGFDPTEEAGFDPVPFARPVAWPVGTGAVPSAHDLMLLQSSRGSAWIDLGILVALLLAFEFTLGVVLALITGGDALGALEDGDAQPGAFDRALLFPVLGVRGTVSLAIVAVIVLSRGQTHRSLGLEWRGLKRNCLIGAASTVVVYVLILMSRPILWLIWPNEPELMNENAERIMNLVPKVHPVAFVGVALGIGIYEEVLFRGFLMTRLRRATESWPVALTASTAVFAALHLVDQTAPAVVWVTILSVVFSLVTIWRRSIVPAIVGHTLFDHSQFLMLYLWAGDSWT